MSTSKICLAFILVLVALLLAGCGPAAPASPPQAPPSIPTEPPATSQLAPTPAPSLPTPPLTLAEVPGATRVRDKDGSVMVYVPAGEFTMGSREDDPDALGDERPQHTVYLSAFWIDQTEVTNEQYGRCVAAGACQASPYADRGPFNDPDYPVVGVSWHDAKAYCQWVGRRLPTEAQWEKAARGTDGRTYPWGDTFGSSRLSFCDANCEYEHKDDLANDGFPYTAPVGSYPTGASPYGALDMAGNVWEWCQDWFDADYYADSPPSDPQGPDSGDSRVVRGVTWSVTVRFVRAANRYGFDPGARLLNIGFRCLSPAP